MAGKVFAAFCETKPGNIEKCWENSTPKENNGKLLTFWEVFSELSTFNLFLLTRSGKMKLVYRMKLCRSF